MTSKAKILDGRCRVRKGRGVGKHTRVACFSEAPVKDRKVANDCFCRGVRAMLAFR